MSERDLNSKPRFSKIESFIEKLPGTLAKTKNPHQEDDLLLGSHESALRLQGLVQDNNNEHFQDTSISGGLVCVILSTFYALKTDYGYQVLIYIPEIEKIGWLYEAELEFFEIDT